MAERKTIVRARRLRRAMTKPELALWDVLRSRPQDIKFRRQHPIGMFVLDFYCPAARLAIEVDGIAHDVGRTRNGTSGVIGGLGSRVSSSFGSRRGMCWAISKAS